MATGRPQTNAEAQRLINQQMDAVRPLLRRAIASGDKAAIEKYSDEMTRLDRMMRATAEISVGGVNIPIGQIGSGLQSGISGLFTAIPDIAIAGVNLFRQPQERITPLGESATKYLGVQNEPTSDESAYAFRVAQGLGSSAVPGTGKAGLLTGGALGAGDVAISQATGLPEGVVSGVYAVGNLTRAGWKGVKDFRESKKFDKFIKDNIPAEEQNVFRQFMLRGQGSDSPIVAASIQKLRSNPEYAELFAKFDQAASDFATRGMAPTTRVTGKQEATEAVATRVQRELEGLKQKRSEAGGRIFEQARGYGADNPLVDPTQTIKNIDELIGRYSAKSTPNADRAVQVLQSIKDRLSSGNVLNPEQAAFSGVAGTVQLTPKRTIDQVQGVLSEFGKKASAGDSLIKDLAISDEKIISAAIFGGMKDDVNNALKTATGSDITALKLLNLGRKQVKDASDTYNDTIAQGMPSFLKDKPLSAVSYEELFSNYKGLNEYQRAKVRSYVGETDQDALNFLDRNIFQDFVKSAQGKNDAGVLTTDLEKLSTNWKSLNDNDRSALVSALGVNAKEFDQRMNDALVFTRRMKVAQPVKGDQDLVSPDTQRSFSALVGSVFGYSPAKAADVGTSALNELFRKQGFTDEQLMRILLTPEGANFLRQGSLTGASAKTLEALTNVPTALQEGSTGFNAVSRLIAPTQQVQQQPQEQVMEQPTEAESQWQIPPDLQQETQPVVEQQWQIPPEFSNQPSAPTQVNINGNVDERQGIFNQELNQLLQRSNAAQASGNQAAMQQITGDIQGLLREAQRNKLQLSVQ